MRKPVFILNKYSYEKYENLFNDRDIKIFNEYITTKISYQKLGNKYGLITRERIRQIIHGIYKKIKQLELRGF